MQDVERQVVSRIYAHRRGWVFTPSAFRDVGSPYAVGMALTRLSKRGTIRRLARGLYDYPKRHPIIGVLNPDPTAVAYALAGKASARLQPSGAYAANLLGLSEQVPAKIMFYTEGLPKKVCIGPQMIELKRASPRNTITAGRISGLVIQAFRYLGPEHVDEKVIGALRKKLDAPAKALLLKDLPYAPAWIARHLRMIAND